MIRRIASPLLFVVLGAMLLPCTLRAYEYKLQYIPPPPPQCCQFALKVIGTQLNADGTIGGDISFYNRACSGRYCGAAVYYYATGIWDSLGNLISSTTPTTTPNAVPPVLYTQSNPRGQGTESVYAANGPAVAGFDNQYGYGGFVQYPASHFTWIGTGEYLTIPRTPPSSFTVQFTSDGDLPLNITSVVSQVVASGYYTNGTGTVTGITGDCLNGPVAPGTTCTLTVTFDPSTIISTGSPYGYAYNNLFLNLASDAGNLLKEWEVRFTISGFQPPDE